MELLVMVLYVLGVLVYAGSLSLRCTRHHDGDCDCSWVLPTAPLWLVMLPILAVLAVVERKPSIDKKLKEQLHLESLERDTIGPTSEIIQAAEAKAQEQYKPGHDIAADHQRALVEAVGCIEIDNEWVHRQGCSIKNPMCDRTRELAAERAILQEERQARVDESFDCRKCVWEAISDRQMITEYSLGFSNPYRYLPSPSTEYARITSCRKHKSAGDLKYSTRPPRRLRDSYHPNI